MYFCMTLFAVVGSTTTAVPNLKATRTVAVGRSYDSIIGSYGKDISFSIWSTVARGGPCVGLAVGVGLACVGLAVGVGLACVGVFACVVGVALFLVVDALPTNCATRLLKS